MPLAVLLVAISVMHMPIPDPFTDSESLGDWRWDILPQTLPRLIPCSLITMLLSLSDGFWIPESRMMRRALWCIAISLIMLTFVLDFLVWGQGTFSANWRLQGSYQSACIAFGDLLREWLKAPGLRRLIVLGFEMPHTLGLALVMLLGSSRASKGEIPSWLLTLSRLSLGINLSNIFVLHYITGRMNDYPIEFSPFHLGLYTLVAWSCASVLAMLSHCLTAPYASLVASVCKWMTTCMRPAAGREHSSNGKQ